jgi:RimK family alpha-L-glutamate ligase
MRFALIESRSTATNRALAETDPPWEPLHPDAALRELRAGDVALGRLDVQPDGDGVDDGLWALGALAARDVVVLNEAPALLATHDKLLTARLLRRSGVPHPKTFHARVDRPLARLGGPVVVKPRFGSGGHEVHLCPDPASLREVLGRLEQLPWFRSHGVLVQELVPPKGFDMRILVAAGRVVGSIYRDAAPGEWRTNIGLGGTRRPLADPPSGAVEVALAAARASRADLVGVDLMPTEDDAWTVVELNGAVEFSPEYRVDGDVFAEASSALRALASGSPDSSPSPALAVAPTLVV